MTPVDPGADPIEALAQAIHSRIAIWCGECRRHIQPSKDEAMEMAEVLAAEVAALAALPAPVPEGVPEDHRVCSHGIYHHGCPSCDRQDPEERL